MPIATLLFPTLAVLVALVSYAQPAIFNGLASAIVPLLTIIMFSMGLTLRPADFGRVAKRPGLVGLGILLQYGVMPVSALLISRALGLSVELTAGMVVVGCSPGGTASNVMSYLAKADVALSVSLTLASSLLAVILTPFLTWLLIGESVPVDAWGMLDSMIRIVLVPVFLGVAVNTFFARSVESIKPYLPVIASAGILAAIAIIVSLNSDNIAEAGLLIVLAVMLHNVSGLALGYAIPRLMNMKTVECRTIALETGMQNSGLGVALALQYFSAAAALPGAIFSVWHSISGSLVAGYWHRTPPRGKTGTTVR